MRYLLTSLLCVLTLSLTAQFICDDLIISEYFEGTGNNKGVEFYNPTSESIDLSEYELQRWSNGESSMTEGTQLFGTLAPLTTWVLVNGQTENIDLAGGAISPMCDPALQSLANQLDNPYPAPTYFNGNDALVLVKNGTIVVDIFGKPGENPGTAWTDDAANGFVDIGDGAAWLTYNHTLQRKYNVGSGVTVPPVVFDTFLEWDTLPVNTWDGLGYHSCICADSQSYIEGCTTPFACNYDPQATIDDGSCLEFDICGICGGDGSSCIQTCVDDDDAVLAVGGCFNAVELLGCAFYWNDILISELCPESCDNCPCDNDFNDNGICDDVEVFGCTYLDALNYDSLATADDGSCLYDDVTSDCPSDIDGDGTVTTQDLLSFLSFFGEVCE